MNEIGYSSSFIKAYKKLIKLYPEINDKFWERVNIFQSNPFNPILKTHKLSGKLNNLWSFSIDFSIRIIFIFDNDEVVTFIDIGTHEDVY
jgi:mRNA-degrading endonuclease YafQ of YafQ-DinJ toxin-antitoxin module